MFFLLEQLFTFAKHFSIFFKNVLRYLMFQQVADLIGADPREIVFTSGATESNNMAIKGVARFYKEKKKHVITTQTVCEFEQTYLCTCKLKMFFFSC